MLAVFNALRSDELLVGIGHVLRATADAGGPLEDFERTQLLSAFSVSRLLAAEQRAGADLLTWLREALLAALPDDGDAMTSAARERVAGAGDGVAVGEAIGDLLAELPAADPRRTAVRGVLREMTDREVAALAQPPVGP
jgi:hypothetical protein